MGTRLLWAAIGKAPDTLGIVDPLSFVIGPQGLGSRALGLGEAFSERLSERLGSKVEVVPTGSYSALLAAVEERRAALAWMPPLVYVQARAATPIHLLAQSVRHGSRAFRGALFVKAGSPYETIKDLQGKRVGWVDPHSTAGHLLPRKAILDAGLDPEDLFSDQSFIGSHRGVARAVYGGEVQVGATYVHLGASGEILSAGWRHTDEDSAFRVLATSDDVPADAIGATDALPEELRRDFTAALLELGQDAEASKLLMELFQAIAFEEPDPDSYEVVEQLRDGIRPR